MGGIAWLTIAAITTAVQAADPAPSPSSSTSPKSSPSASPSPSPKPRGKMVEEFSTAMKKCLKTTDLACLETLVHPRMYFPEQVDFGCETADKERNYIAAKEFVKCAATSVTKRTGCGDFNSDLREALAECFDNSRAKYDAGGNYYQAAGGSLCHLEELDGKLVVSSVACGC